MTKTENLVALLMQRGAMVGGEEGKAAYALGFLCECLNDVELNKTTLNKMLNKATATTQSLIINGYR